MFDDCTVIIGLKANKGHELSLIEKVYGHQTDQINDYRTFLRLWTSVLTQLMQGRIELEFKHKVNFPKKEGPQ